MKNKLFTLAAALMLVAVIGSVYAAPALAAVIKAALVKNIDEKGRSPYQAYIACGSGIGTNSCTALADPVPAGMRLVVENVSVEATTAPGSRIISFHLLPSTNPTNLRAAFHLDLNGTQAIGPTRDYHSTNNHVLVYFEAGETPVAETVASSLDMTSKVTIDGYLVNLAN